jgi:hypothetical protein
MRQKAEKTQKQSGHKMPAAVLQVDSIVNATLHARYLLTMKV